MCCAVLLTERAGRARGRVWCGLLAVAVAVAVCARARVRECVYLGGRTAGPWLSADPTPCSVVDADAAAKRPP